MFDQFVRLTLRRLIRIHYICLSNFYALLESVTITNKVSKLIKLHELSWLIIKFRLVLKSSMTEAPTIGMGPYLSFAEQINGLVSI